MKNLLHGIKKKWTAYLERLGEANQKTYGNQRLNCCDMPDRRKNSISKQR